jgi:hypothetical protein
MVVAVAKRVDKSAVGRDRWSPSSSSNPVFALLFLSTLVAYLQIRGALICLCPRFKVRVLILICLFKEIFERKF